MTKENKKVGFWGKVKNFCSDHATELIMVGMAGVGLFVGLDIGGSIGHRKGYRKGISDFAGQVPKIMDYCGSVASALTVETLWDQAEDSGHEEYVRCFENIDPETTGRKVCRRFYDDEGVKGLLDQMNKAQKGDW